MVECVIDITAFLYLQIFIKIESQTFGLNGMSGLPVSLNHRNR